MFTRFNHSITLFLLAIIVFIFGFSNAVLAHRATVFAWVEGNMVHSESKFAGGKKAIESPIEVLDPDGKVLVHGMTNDKGEFSFKIPQKTQLTIVLKAGMGHKGSWTLSADELGAAADETGEKITESSSVQPVSTQTSTVNNAETSGTCLNKAAIEQIVESALDRKLNPIQSSVNRLSDTTGSPTLKDILGGLGYIFGLMGIGAYVNYRRRTKDNAS